MGFAFLCIVVLVSLLDNTSGRGNREIGDIRPPLIDAFNVPKYTVPLYVPGKIKFPLVKRFVVEMFHT